MTIKRQTLIFSLLVGAGFGGGLLVGATGTHDPRFDDVDALLEKAVILLGIADCTTTEKAQRACEHHTQKALNHVEVARQDLADAIVAADSGGLR